MTANTSDSFTVTNGKSFSKMAADMAVYEDDYVPPVKEQGLSVDAFDNSTVDDYLTAIRQKLPENSSVTHISRITKGRVGFFVESVKTAEYLLTAENNILTVCGRNTFIRPLYEKAKRVIISNVSPILPNKYILQKLRDMGVIPKSKITLVKAGSQDPENKNVHSWRRQMFVDADDVDKLPGSATFNYMDINFHIFFTTQSMTCFFCKEAGHLVKNCPAYAAQQQKQLSQLNEEPPILPAASTPLTQEIDTNSLTTAMSQPDEKLNPVLHKQPDLSAQAQTGKNVPFLKPQNPVTKRTRAEISTRSNASESTTTMPRPKVTKTEPQPITKEMISSEINNAQKSIPEEKMALHPLTIDKFTELMQSSFDTGIKKFPALAGTYTSNATGLIIMITDFHAGLTEPRIKTRFTKVNKALASAIKKTEGLSDESMLLDSSTDDEISQCNLQFSQNKNGSEL